MRYEKGRRDATKSQILGVAARRFRGEGVAAVGLTAIMGDAGLTNGAFYTHFGSKEDLVRETLIHALEENLRNIDRHLGLEAAFRTYLSPQHRDNPGLGCPSSALLAEVARQPFKTREAYTEGLRAVLDMILDRLLVTNPLATRATATAIFGMMLGSLQLSRAVTDAALSDSILEAGVQGAMALSERARSADGSALTVQNATPLNET